MNPLTGPAFVSGVNHALAALRVAMQSGERADAKLYHGFPPDSAQELEFDEGAHYASVRALAGAEFAVQCRDSHDPTTN